MQGDEIYVDGEPSSGKQMGCHEVDHAFQGLFFQLQPQGKILAISQTDEYYSRANRAMQAHFFILVEEIMFEPLRLKGRARLDCYKAEQKCWVPIQLCIDGSVCKRLGDKAPEVDRLIKVINEEKEKHRHLRKEYEDQVKLGFCRLFGDRTVNYGDGGDCELIYPVYYYDILPKTRLRMDEDLTLLGKATNDFHESGIVQDLIDPDLNPHYTEYKSYEIARTQQILDSKGKEEWYGEKRELEKHLYSLKNKLKEMPNTDARYKYQWIPCDVLATEEKLVLKSRIHNLPFERYPRLYENMAIVLNKMWPLFKSVLNLESYKNKKLQFVIKSQCYHINPGILAECGLRQSYKGHWHKEGLTENIVAAGVYYTHISPHLLGGNVKFRVDKIPRSNYDINCDKEITVRDGTAFVFSNSLPHRVRKMVNVGETVATRRFVNFFLIDPAKPLKSTAELIPTEAYRALLKEVSHHLTGKDFPPELFDAILLFLGANLEDAKESRENARNHMRNLKSGWGWINWGNCGEALYVDNHETWDSYERGEMGNTLHSTSSGSNEVRARETYEEECYSNYILI